MKKNEVPGWLMSSVTLLIYIGVTTLLKLDVKLGLLIWIAYHITINHAEKEEMK